MPTTRFKTQIHLFPPLNQSLTSPLPPSMVRVLHQIHTPAPKSVFGNLKHAPLFLVVLWCKVYQFWDPKVFQHVSHKLQKCHPKCRPKNGMSHDINCWSCFRCLFPVDPENNSKTYNIQPKTPVRLFRWQSSPDTKDYQQIAKAEPQKQPKCSKFQFQKMTLFGTSSDVILAPEMSNKWPQNDPQIWPNGTPWRSMGAPGGGTGPQKNPCRFGGHFGIKHGFKLTQNNCRMISKSPKRFWNLSTITYTEIIPLNPMGHLNLLGEHLRICAAKHPESQATCRTILFAMPPLAVVIVVVCGLSVCTVVSTQCRPQRHIWGAAVITLCVLNNIIWSTSKNCQTQILAKAVDFIYR